MDTAEAKVSESPPESTWRDLAFVDLFRTNRTGYFPWVTAVLVVAISVLNWEIVRDGSVGVVWHALATRFSEVRAGEVWRLGTSWLPHMSMFHLWPDVVYLAVVGAVAERTLGRVWLVTVFLGANTLGGVAALLWDSRYDSLCGSSDGIHAMLIGLSGILLVSRMRVDHVIACVFVIWLSYHTVMGLATGAMGWPMDDLNNGGFDHLAGVVCGGLAAVYAAHRERARMRACSG